MSKKFKTFFWSDSDGYSSKDHLMVLFTTVYLLFISVTFVFAILDKETGTLLNIIESMDNIVVTVVAGVFSIKGIEKFREKREEDKQEPTI